MPQPKRGKQNKRKAPPSLTAPLSPGEARKMAGAEAQAEYNPTIRAAKQMKKGSVARQKNIGEWFQGLQNQIQQSATATDASYGQANAALLAHMNAAQQAAAQSQGQIAQNNFDMTQLTGADPSLTAPSLAEGAAAANQRNIAGASLAAPIAQAGASQAAYLRNTGINARREGIDQKLGEAKRRDKIAEDIAALKKERSQTALGNFREIRGEERDYGIQRAAFNLEKREGAANRAQDERQFQQGLDVDWYNAKTGRKNAQSGGEGGLTPSEKRGIKQGRANAMVTVKNLYSAAKKPPQTPEEWAAFTQLVASEEEISPQEAQWAVNRYRKQIRQKEKNANIFQNPGAGW